MTETAASQTAPNSNNGSRPQHINTPEREIKDETFRDGLVQQGLCTCSDHTVVVPSSPSCPYMQTRPRQRSGLPADGLDLIGIGRG